MTDSERAVALRALAMQSSAVLLTRGLQVEAVSVHGVAARLVESAAEEAGISVDEAIHLVTPEAVAESVMETAATAGQSRATAHHAARPARSDHRVAQVPGDELGHLVMAAGQAGKYAGVNDDAALTAHLLDLVTEVGAALTRGGADSPSGVADACGVEVGVLDELADVVDRVADRVEAAEWSICPCGREHGQRRTDQGVVRVMRYHAGLARKLRDQVE